MAPLAFEISATIRHDGQGGVADGLATVELTETWIRANAPLVEEVLGGPSVEEMPGGSPASSSLRSRGFDFSALVVDDGVREQLVGVRRAVRSLFARAVSPAPPSKADDGRLLDSATALRRLNEAADALGSAQLEWPDGGEPIVRWAGGATEPVELLLGAVGRSGIDFLASPDRLRLRACPAARCVKYFLQDDPRQTWCSPSCGNRERVNRHYQRKHAG
ncbi:CGNR zinc finger domain-containing protein [Kribbella sp. NPDC051718]|uniref:CGNR zinc finger domain-containing protein n=1 Tax=Kribbella sp. NPDC051718 TaxID=3155168 RepID=UPI0034298B75